MRPSKPSGAAARCWVATRAAVLGALMAALPGSLGAEQAPGSGPTLAPARVVSLNLCTDQLAIALGAPGQVVSVSALARDPRLSVMARAAQDYPINNGSAEAVVRLRPDLVLAGSFTTRATVEMLERLGIKVARFAPVSSLSEARDNIADMGRLLGREAQADAMIAAFDDGLAALQSPAPRRPRTALYYALGNTAGRQTLPGDILHHAGHDNIAAERNLPFGGALPLESLILDAPDLILVGRPYAGHARATEVLQHPALARSDALYQITTGPAWTCEGPALLEAVAEMVALRRQWEAKQ